MLQWPSNGGINQQWTIAYVDSGWYKVTARHSGKCLEVANGSTADGANVRQYTDNGDNAQRWQFGLAGAPVSVSETEGRNLVEAFTLEQNVPNPFNPDTEIRYHLATAATIRLEIVDILGRRVRVLNAGHVPAGTTSIRWDAKSTVGMQVPAGLYFCRLRVETPGQVF
ncbi:RICIN domain-containing protein [bacterium]|nr:RICIN domain-containing protein [bacterium]